MVAFQSSRLEKFISASNILLKKLLSLSPKEVKQNLHALINVDYGHESKIWSMEVTRFFTTTSVSGEEKRPIYYWMIYGLFLTACTLIVVQADGWSADYCQGNLCVKYRPVDRKQFCRITNFRVNYRRTVDTEVIAVLPQEDGSCMIISNLITRRGGIRGLAKASKRYSEILVKKQTFDAHD